MYAISMLVAMSGGMLSNLVERKKKQNILFDNFQKYFLIPLDVLLFLSVHKFMQYLKCKDIK